MQIVLWIFLLIAIGLVVFYFRAGRRLADENWELNRQLRIANSDVERFERQVDQLKEEKLQAEEEAEKHVKAKLYEMIFQTAHYNSVKDLQNKLKTVLATASK